MARFKLETELLGLQCSIEEDQELEFNYKSPIPVLVSFKAAPHDENGSARIGAVCTALSIQEMACEVNFEMHTNIGGSRVKWELLSDSTRDLIDNIYIHLGKLSQSTVAIFNWTHGLDSPPDPCPSQKSRALYSEDGEKWFEYYMGRKAVVLAAETTHFIFARNARTDEVVTRVEAGLEVPIGRQLFHEAWSQIGINPRSALVVGVAAAEVSLARLITTLMSGTRSHRTPTFRKMLRECLPKLPLKVQPPSEIMQQIEAAIKYRNAVVHRGKSPPDREYLGGMLRAISDFLWMCDVYLGEVWAVRYVSFEMQKKWRIRS